jgi:ADP-ribose pyrophosphatase YjhB (NUDIX family)
MPSQKSRRYPQRPLVGVGALIIRGDRIVLVERGREPQKGKWSLPGGALETGETISEGLCREVQEETGLDVRLIQLVEIFERIVRDSRGDVEYHYVLLDYLCRVRAGRLRASDDSADARWVPRSEVHRYPLTEGTLEVIDKAFRLA